MKVHTVALVAAMVAPAEVILTPGTVGQIQTGLILLVEMGPTPGTADQIRTGLLLLAAMTTTCMCLVGMTAICSILEMIKRCLKTLIPGTETWIQIGRRQAAMLVMSHGLKKIGLEIIGLVMIGQVSHLLKTMQTHMEIMDMRELGMSTGMLISIASGEIFKLLSTLIDQLLGTTNGTMAGE